MQARDLVGSRLGAALRVATPIAAFGILEQAASGPALLTAVSRTHAKRGCRSSAMSTPPPPQSRPPFALRHLRNASTA